MSLLNKASLIQIPSGYKDGTLYSAKPTNGDGDFTFSRGSNLAATRVNSDGLIEKGRENELTYSNTFDTHWTGQLISSVVSGQSGYDGTSDAWLLTPTASTGQHHLSNALTGPAGVYNTSYYVKDSGAGFAFLQCVDSGGGNFYGYFDLSDGSSVSNNYGGSGTIISTDSVSLGNGWFRLSMTMNGSGATSSRVGIASARAVGTHLAILTTADQILIQDAQLEVGLVATDYIETGASTAQAGILEDMPRLDYSGGATCPSLLLEPQRTNLLPQSEYFGASWSASNITITSNATTSPEGVDNATLLANTSALNYLVYGASVSASTTYQFSFYAKNVDATAANVIFYDASNSAVISTTSYVGDLTTEWKRLVFLVTTPVGCTSLSINIVNGLDGSLFVYGAQFEAASYVSSYIPTYGASVTRGSDSCSKTGISSLIGGTSGTVFFDITTNAVLTSDNYKQFFYYTDSSANQGYMYLNSSNVLVTNVSFGAMSSSITLSPNTRYKVALAYANNDFALYVNGVSVATSSSGTPYNFENLLSLGSYDATSEWNEFVFNQYTHFQSRLTTAELAELTTI